MTVRVWETHEAIVVPGDEKSVRNSEGAIIELKDGSLLLAWSDFCDAESEDWGPSRLSAKISKNGGITWSEPCVMLDNEAMQSTPGSISRTWNPWTT